MLINKSAWVGSETDKQLKIKTVPVKIKKISN